MRCATRLALAFLMLLAVPAAAQIQKWETPEGSIYFGTNPPAGSVRADGTDYGREQKPIAELPPERTQEERARGDDERAERERVRTARRINNALSSARQKLAQVRDRIDQVQRRSTHPPRGSYPSWPAYYAAKEDLENDKYADLSRLRTAESELKEVIYDLEEQWRRVNSR